MLTKKCAPKFVFFNENKIRKIWMIFDVEIDFESQISELFDTSPLRTNSQNSMISFNYS